MRPQLDEVWYCDLGPDERVRRLVSRHERFGKDHDAAVSWVMRIDQPNADLIAGTRPHADLVIPEPVLLSIGNRKSSG